jgi:hypothetical protein
MDQMPNERLRALLLQRGQTPDKLAEAVHVDPKTVEVRWVARESLGGYAMDRSMRLRIGHFLEGRAEPYLG